LSITRLARFLRLLGPERPAPTAADHDPSRRAVGVYNSYWNTFGGGELHALSVLQQVARPGDDITLISETEFDLDALKARFGLKLPHCTKLIVREMTSALTAQFDLFINSSFNSNLVSQAQQSLYLVSFPTARMSAAAKRSYTFLFNSPYTARWARQLWGEVKGETIYPTLSLNFKAASKQVKKEKVIVAVGRLSRQGHAKNQDKIIESYLRAKARGHLKGWKLYMIGSLDRSRADDVTYYEELMALTTADRSIHVLPDAPPQKRDEILAKASAYVHATGLGQLETAPEKQEHFGISVLEACLKGCCPVVYFKGGPAELVAELGLGATFNTADELVYILGQLKPDVAKHAPAIKAAATRFCAANAEKAAAFFKNHATR